MKAHTILATCKRASLWILVLFLGCMFLPASVGQAQTYSITNLGPAPDNAIFTSQAQSINNKGEVLASGVFGPYSYGTSLYLPKPAYGFPAGLNSLYYYGGSNFLARTLNDVGQIVGEVNSHAARWQNSQVTDYGTLGGSSSTAADIANTGEIAGYSFRNGFGDQAPFLINTVSNTMVLMPGFPTTNATGSASFINNSRQVIGSYGLVDPTNQSVSGFTYFICQDGQFQDLSQVIGFTNEQIDTNHYVRLRRVESLNDQGEVAGLIEEGVTSNFSTTITYSQFLYLTHSAFGYASGFHRFPMLSNSPPNFHTFTMNNYGLAIYSVTPGGHSGDPRFDFLWDGGTPTRLENLLPTNSGWSNLAAASINDLGQIVGQGTQGGKKQAFLMNPPPLRVAITALPDRAHPGDPIQVALIVRNATADAITNVHPTGPLTVLGSNNAISFVSGPTPTNITSLPSIGLAIFSYAYVATNFGKVRFVGSVQTMKDGSTITSGSITSSTVSIQIKGDLLIKRTGESASSYAINDEYQSNPAGAQVRTNTVAQAELSEFQVQVQNDEPQPRTFNLKAAEGSNPGWDRKYLFNNQDISAAVRTASGYTLPQLASNATHTVTVRMTATNAPNGDQLRVLLSLEDPLAPGETLDVVEAVTQLAAEIIVNTTGDEADADVNDSVPDVDLVKPGLQTTLRCAIDYANRHAGADIIKFQIPASDPNWVDGVPQIEPATPLPDITKTMIIDGWSQNTNSSTPPVALSGKRLLRPPLPSDYLSFHVWPGAAGALVLRGTACEVRGLVIQQFPTGLELAGGGSHIIEGCFFGMSADGTASLANGLVGGGDRNYSLNAPPRGIAVLPGQPPAAKPSRLRPRGWDIRSESPLNRIGGQDARQQNHFGSVRNFIDPFETGQTLSFAGGVVISPVAIWLDGSGASGNQVLGNVFGLRSDLAGPLHNSNGFDSYADVEVVNAVGTLIGGETPGTGNLFTRAEAGISVYGAAAVGTTIYGNTFGQYLRQEVETGVEARDCGLIQVGGVDSGQANHFSEAIASVNFFGVHQGRIHGNEFGVNEKVDETSSYTPVAIRGAGGPIEILGNVFQGFWGFAIELDTGDDATAASGVMVLNNLFWAEDQTFHPAAGVRLSSGQGHGIHRNYVKGLGNLFLATFFEAREERTSSVYSILNSSSDFFDVDVGPNDRLNQPFINSVKLSGGQLTIQGDLRMRINSGPYTLYFYTKNSVNNVVRYVGQATVASVDASEAFPFTITIPAGPVTGDGSASGGDYDSIGAIAAGADGSCSLISQGGLVQVGPDAEGDSVADSLESRVPNRLSPQATGDGNGDGVPDASQANVVSFPSPTRGWITLAAPAGAQWENIHPGVPTPGPSPQNMVFPSGFQQISLRDARLASGMTVELFLAGDATPTTLDSLWAFTGTSASSQWTRIPVTATGYRSWQFTLWDGNPEDANPAAGVVTLNVGPAVILPPPPPLVIKMLSPGNLELSWSGNASVALETSFDLKLWRPASIEGRSSGGGITRQPITALRDFQFFRLRPVSTLLAAVPAPTLNIQRTSTNTFLLSWSTSVTGFALQQNTNLVTGTWTSVTNAVNVTNSLDQVLVSPATGSRFFRLKSP